ncbi:MAG: TonB family protein [Bacteroidota bacterium]
MRDALDLLLGMGEWAISAVWLPVLVWTALALLAEATLRLRPHPLLALGVRQSLLWALPVGLLASLALPGLLPATVMDQVVAFRPQALDGIVLPAIEVGVTPAVAQGPTLEALPLLPLAAALALLVVAVFAAVRLSQVVVGLVRLGRLAAGDAPSEVQHEAAEAARAVGVTRTVRAVTTDVPTVPFTFGWRRPVVVVPAELVGDTDALRLILAHEVAHVARGDFAAGVAERVLTALFGWHPLVRALARRIDLDRERATDAAVLAGHPSRRRDYASLLLSFSRLPSPALALGAAPGSRSLTTRITDMQDAPLPSDRLRRLARTARGLGLGLFLATVGIATVVALGPTQTEALAASLGDGEILISEPIVTIDGVRVFEAEGDLTSRPFRVLTFAVGGWGRYLISDEAFEGAEPAGTFSRDALRVTTGGHDLVMDLSAPPFGDVETRPAFARFDAFPEAAPLAPSDPRLDEVWFSLGSSLDDVMPVRATYRDRQLDDFEMGDALIALAAAMGEDGESDETDATEISVETAATVTIEGIVRDAMTGRPLAGATVLVVGGQIGAETDPEGRFVIRGVDLDGETQIRIVLTGYESLTVVPQIGEPLRIGLVPTDADERADRRRNAQQAVERAQQRRAAREARESLEDPEVFTVVEEPPTLIGGAEGFANRLSYPASAREAGVEGTVYVQFIVETNGRVGRADCLESPNDVLCAAATTAVRESEFTPGRQRGQAVKVKMTLPVRFTLPDENE